MDNHFTVKQVGVVRCDDSGFRIELSPACIKPLSGLDGFSYLNIFWWFSGCDNEADRSVLAEAKPYTKGPDTMSAFATRSPSAQIPSRYPAPMSPTLMQTRA